MLGAKHIAWSRLISQQEFNGKPDMTFSDALVDMVNAAKSLESESSSIKMAIDELVDIVSDFRAKHGSAPEICYTGPGLGITSAQGTKEFLNVAFEDIEVELDGRSILVHNITDLGNRNILGVVLNFVVDS